MYQCYICGQMVTELYHACGDSTANPIPTQQLGTPMILPVLDRIATALETLAEQKILPANRNLTCFCCPECKGEGEPL